MKEQILNHLDLEEKNYNQSLESFKCDVSSEKKAFSTMMPPPNVTGYLHLGHALTYTLPDILVRFKRMMGYDVLWQAGTDHAGIATQMVVERNLAQDGITRDQLGREEFLKKVWAWKEESGSTIVKQQKRLRISPDWSRSCFTMDENLSKAVIEAFVRLYDDGLIYRDKRLVNWDTKLQTAVSDLEVISKQEKGFLWYIKYKIENSNDFITVATTRPETMLGDTAIAVHPDDERYQKFIGKNVIIPIVNRIIPIVADEYCDQSKGSGAVKITPAHDFNDFEVGKRHLLPSINILDKSGNLNDNTPKDYQGLTVNQARKKILDDLDRVGVLEKQEPTDHTKPYSQRTDTEIQPLLTDQWFVDAKKLAKPAIDAVKNGETKFYPLGTENIYYRWMEDIQPWCISRQIWWGHQIPAWYTSDQKIIVAKDEQEARQKALEKYSYNGALKRDDDVLDTWFSSGLWAFATLGWSKNNKELEKYYPTDVLVTGIDIIFFWVARMMMLSIYFTKKAPFKEVYLHNLVRDEKGQKMSKTKGNVIDPNDLMDIYGSDALRFTLAFLCVPNSDLKLGAKSVENARNFITKLRNAHKYLKLKNLKFDRDFSIKDLPWQKIWSNKDCFSYQKNPSEMHEYLSRQQGHPLNLWMVKQIYDFSCNPNNTDNFLKSIENYRFDNLAKGLYNLFWSSFCDIYLEGTKVLLTKLESRYDSGNTRDNPYYETENTIIWCFKQILKMLYPIIPSVVDEIWQEWHDGKTITSYVSSLEEDELFGAVNDLGNYGEKNLEEFLSDYSYSPTSVQNISHHIKNQDSVSAKIYYAQKAINIIETIRSYKGLLGIANKKITITLINDIKLVNQSFAGIGGDLYDPYDKVIEPFRKIIENMCGCVIEVKKPSENKNKAIIKLPFSLYNHEIKYNQNKINHEIILDFSEHITQEEMLEIVNKKITELEDDIEKLEKKLANERYKQAKPEDWNIDKISLDQKLQSKKNFQASIKVVS